MIALSGGIVLEEALDLLSDRLLMMMNILKPKPERGSQLAVWLKPRRSSSLYMHMCYNVHSLKLGMTCAEAFTG